MIRKHKRLFKARGIVETKTRTALDIIEDLNRYMTDNQIGFEEVSQTTDIPEPRIRKFWALEDLPRKDEQREIERYLCESQNTNSD